MTSIAPLPSWCEAPQQEQPGKRPTRPQSRNHAFWFRSLFWPGPVDEQRTRFVVLSRDASKVFVGAPIGARPGAMTIGVDALVFQRRRPYRIGRLEQPTRRTH